MKELKLTIDNALKAFDHAMKDAFPGICKKFRALIDASGMVESVTNAPEKKSSEEWEQRWKKETGTKIVDLDGWDRKNFLESWFEEITWEEFQRRALISSCLPIGTKYDETKPSVDDSLAKANKINVIKTIHEDGTMTVEGDKYIAKIGCYESAIRERNEKMAQSMTVEEFKEWHGEWYESNSQQALTESLYEMIVRKIKERNETRHPFDPGREVGGTD